MKLRNCFRWGLLLFFAALLLEGQVAAPRIGVVHYGDGSVWTLNGLRANFIVGSRLFQSATAASFSDEGGLVAIPGEVDLVHLDGSVIGRYPTDEDQPDLNSTGGILSATVWLPSKEILLRWDGKSFVAAEPEFSDPAFHQKSFTLFSDADGFEVQAADGSTRTLPITAPDVRIERMSGDWLHLSSASAHRDWALLLNEKELKLSELPAPPREAGK
jgi:hypothetical protein